MEASEAEIPPMSLAEWHERLHVHFRDLHQERVQEGGKPVFGLEHGLDGGEIATLKDDVREYIKSYRNTGRLLKRVRTVGLNTGIGIIYGIGSKPSARITVAPNRPGYGHSISPLSVIPLLTLFYRKTFSAS